MLKVVCDVCGESVRQQRQNQVVVWRGMKPCTPGTKGLAKKCSITITASSPHISNSSGFTTKPLPGAGAQSRWGVDICEACVRKMFNGDSARIVTIHGVELTTDGLVHQEVASASARVVKTKPVDFDEDEDCDDDDENYDDDDEDEH